jgi:CheY-like chemotaxis protein
MSAEIERFSLLLVEDSPADVYLVREAMLHEGLNVDLNVVEDGEKAIEIVNRVDAGGETRAPELMLLDINVPRRTGNEVLERIRRSPRCARIPVLMISSSDSPAERGRAFALGANGYFRKPSSLSEFMQLGKVVRQLRDQSRAVAETVPPMISSA